jgi:hypothetical protein
MMAKKTYDRPASWKIINRKFQDIIDKRKHPYIFFIKKHWRWAFEYSEKEMIILLFVLAATLLLIKPWLGSTLLVVLTIIHYIIHTKMDNKKHDN